MKVRLPKGVGGGPQNMDAMMRQVQKFQEEREALAADLESREYDVAAGGGAVNLKIDGTLRVTEIKIAPEIIAPDDPETLEDIIVAAGNAGSQRDQDATATAMSALAAKFGIPDGAF